VIFYHRVTEPQRIHRATEKREKGEGLPSIAEAMEGQTALDALFRASKVLTEDTL
jgi:hypothetical protein